MATAAAPVSARKPFVCWSLTFAPYLQELRDAAKDGKGPDRAPLKKKVFNGRFFKVNVARQAIAALFDSKALSERWREGDAPFEMCVHCIGRESELPKLIAAIKAEKKEQKKKGQVAANMKAKEETSEKSEGEWDSGGRGGR
jgi:hypothetical protein